MTLLASQIEGNSLNARLRNLSVITVKSYEGHDTTGTGSDIKPFKSITAAIDSIVSYNPSLIYFFDCYGEFTETNLQLFPNFIFNGNGGNLIVTNQLTVASAWAGASGILTIDNFSGLDLPAGLNLDFSSATFAVLRLSSLTTASSSTWIIQGNSSGGTIVILEKIFGFSGAPPITINDCYGGISGCAPTSLTIVDDGTGSDYNFTIFDNTILGDLTIKSTNSRNMNVNSSSNFVAGNVLLQTTSSGQVNVNQSSITYYGSYTLDGVNSNLNTDAMQGIPLLIGGATASQITYRDLADTINAGFSPSSYTPTDQQVKGHLEGIDNELNVGTGRVVFGIAGGGIFGDSTFTFDIFSKNLTVNSISALFANIGSYGVGYHEITDGLSLTLTNPMFTYINVTNAGSGLSIFLPDMTDSRAIRADGIPTFYVVNNGAQPVSVIKNDLSTLVTIQPGEGYQFIVTSNATSAGSFIFEIFLSNAISAPDQEIIFGSGSGVTSSDALTYNALTETLEVPQIKSNTFGEGYHEIDDGLSYTVINPQPTVINVTNSGSGLGIFLPDMTESAALRFDKFPSFYLYNNGTQPVDVVDNALTTLVSIQPGEGYQFTVTSNSTVAGSFIFEKILIPEINLDTFGSGYLALTVGAGTINLTNPLKNRIVMTGLGTGSVRFPVMNAVDSMTSGINTFCIITNNCSSLNDICNNAGTVIVQVYPGETYAFFIKDNASANGSFDYVNITGITVNSQIIDGIKTFLSTPIFSALTTAGIVHNDASGDLTSSLIVDADVDNAANIDYSKINTDTLGSGYLSITSSVNYILTNPSPTVINANFTTSGRELRLAAMNASDSLKAIYGATIIVRNVGSNKFNLISSGGDNFWEILPTQTITLEVISNSSLSGDFNTDYSMTAPVGNQIPYGLSEAFGNELLISSPALTFDGNVLTVISVTGGIEPPSMTTTQRLAQSPTNPRIVFDSILGQYFGWNPTTGLWVILG